MKNLTKKDVNKIVEAVLRNLPAKSSVNWTYKINKKSHSLNFRIK